MTINRKSISGMKRKPTKRVAIRTKRGLGAMKPKKIKKSSLRRLKLKLEALQKQLTIKLYGTDCFTCPAIKLEGKNLQLGHVPWPRSVLSQAAKFDYRFTRSQCMVCNIYRGGMGAIAYARMVRDKIPVDMLWQFNLDTKGKTYPASWFQMKTVEYELALMVNNGTTHVTVATPKNWKCKRPNCKVDYHHTHGTYATLATTKG